jgi:hypothetical protein
VEWPTCKCGMPLFGDQNCGVKVEGIDIMLFKHGIGYEVEYRVLLIDFVVLV